MSAETAQKTNTGSPKDKKQRPQNDDGEYILPSNFTIKNSKGESIKYQQEVVEESEKARKEYNISSHTMNILTTKLIGEVLALHTGDSSSYKINEEQSPGLSAYQKHMLQFQKERDKANLVGSSLIQLQDATNLANKRKGSQDQVQLELDLKDEDNEYDKEIVGLDHALIELSLQAKFLSERRLTDPSLAHFGIENIFSSHGQGADGENSSTQYKPETPLNRRKFSIKNGKDLLALAYGLKTVGEQVSQHADVPSSHEQSSFGNFSQNAVLQQQQQQQQQFNNTHQSQDMRQNLIAEELSEDGLTSDESSSTSQQVSSGVVTEKAEKVQIIVTEETDDLVKSAIKSKDEIDTEDGNVEDHLHIEKECTISPQEKKGVRKALRHAQSDVNEFPSLGSMQKLQRQTMQNLESPRLQLKDHDADNVNEPPLSSHSMRKVRQKRDKFAQRHSQTLQVEDPKVDLIDDDATASQKVMRRVQEQKNLHLNIPYIHKLLALPKRERTKAQIGTLIKYLKTIKVFVDLLVRSHGASQEKANEAQQRIESQDEDASFEHLASCIKVQQILTADYQIMEEGQDGELFYIILEGECQVQKATPYVIHKMTHNEAIQDKLIHYFKAFMEHYDDIFWAGMDIQRNDVDEMLGILRDNQEGGSGKIIALPEWPISKAKQLILQVYVRRHEKDNSFKNSEEQPFLLVNKHLVNLRKGAGFGELALMSEVKRMASVFSATPCVLATLTQKDFSSVIRRAQKRKMESQVGFLKRFSLFKNLSNMKLQKLFYLLKKTDQPKQSVLFQQKDQPINGVYLIQEGEVAYEIKHEILKPDYSKNSWLNPNVMNNGLNKQSQRREIALFTNNEIIGFEEILRKRMLKLLQKEFLQGEGNDYFKNQSERTDELFADSTLGFRNFTAIVKSSKAHLYYLKRQDLEDFLRFLPNARVKDELDKRMAFLKNQINCIMSVAQTEYQERQKIELAKKFLIRGLKFNQDNLPATKREELKQDVKNEMHQESQQRQQQQQQQQQSKMITKSSMQTSSLDHSVMTHSQRQQSSSLDMISRAKSLGLDVPTTQMISIQLQNDKEQPHLVQLKQQQQPEQANRFRESKWSLSNANVLKDESLEREKAVKEFAQQFIQVQTSDQQNISSNNSRSRRKQKQHESTSNLLSKRFSVDVRSLDNRKTSLLSHHSLSISSQRQHHFSVHNQNVASASFLPSLKLKKATSPRHFQQFDNPYSHRNKQAFPKAAASSSVRLGRGAFQKRMLLQNNRKSLQHKNNSTNQDASNDSSTDSLVNVTFLGDAPTSSQMISQEFAVVKHDDSIMSSLETLTDGHSRQLSSVQKSHTSKVVSISARLDNSEKRDIEAAQIVLGEADYIEMGVAHKEDLVQRDFIKYSHKHGDPSEAHNLQGFTRVDVPDQKKISQMRRAENNAIERKQAVYRTKLENDPSKMTDLQTNASKQSVFSQRSLLSKRHQSISNANNLDAKTTIGGSQLSLVASITNNQMANYSNSQTAIIPSIISTEQIEHAMSQDDEEFKNHMLQVLDGIIAPSFDPKSNRKRIQVMQDRMSDTCELMARKQRSSYRKSDDALLDKNTLGPVYANILRKRRRKGSEQRRKKAINIQNQSTYDSCSLDNQQSTETLPTVMISPKAMARHSSMQSIKNRNKKSLKDLSVSSLQEDTSFIIKSIKASTRHQSNIKQQSTQIGGQYVMQQSKHSYSQQQYGEQYKLEANQQSSRLAMLRVGNISSSHQNQDRQDQSKLSNEHSSVVSCNLMPAIIRSNKNLQLQNNKDQFEDDQYEQTPQVQLIMNKNSVLKDKLLADSKKRKLAKHQKEQHHLTQLSNQQSTIQMTSGIDYLTNETHVTKQTISTYRDKGAEQLEACVTLMQQQPHQQNNNGNVHGVEDSTIELEQQSISSVSNQKSKIYQPQDLVLKPEFVVVNANERKNIEIRATKIKQHEPKRLNADLGILKDSSGDKNSRQSQLDLNDQNKDKEVHSMVSSFGMMRLKKLPTPTSSSQH